MTNKEQILEYTGSGERIDSWLTKQFSYSRNFFQHILERKGITVYPSISGGKNGIAIGLKVKKSYRLHLGDSIVIENLERFMDGGILEECPAIPLDIRHEEADYMVIYKEKGVLSHPNSVRDVSSPSVVGGLYHYFQDQGLPSMGSFIRAGLVHRLDKETDGLMIIAKTEKGLAYFKNLFQQKSLAETIEQKEAVPLKKYYRAVCEITQEGKEFINTIKNQLPYIIQEEVIPKTPHPIIKEGITKILHIYPVVETRRGVSNTDRVIIDIEILTGRTHQIRYHLSTHGLPIVGDYVYGTDTGEPMGLTARKLVFIDPVGDKILLEV